MTRCGDVFGEDGAGLGGITVVGVVVKRVEVGPLAAVEETDVGEVAVSREEVLEFVRSGQAPRLSALDTCWIPSTVTGLDPVEGSPVRNGCELTAY